MPTPPHRLQVLAVLGPGKATEEQLRVAASVGECAARHGWVVLTGGGPGVMEAACCGAAEAGGLTVGVLPVERLTQAYPNPWVLLPIFTGAGMARNAFNVLSASLCLAIGGGPGTLSEIAMALKAGIEVWCFRSWVLEAPEGATSTRPLRLESHEELLAKLKTRLASGEGRSSWT
jgi:uncharacterized protein (TIGR00725 family)